MSNSLSIIIPAWNEEKVLPRTISFLRKLKLPFGYRELIFIAGGTDNTYNLCKDLKFDNFDEVVILKQNPKDFKSGALIKGLTKSKGNIVILIDSDVLVSPNLAIEISKFLMKFDVVCCDFIPMMQKGLWFNYYILLKLIWSKNYNNLSSLIGGATISIRKAIIDEIGVKNLFTSKSTGGVDYYMGLVLKKNNKKIGFVKNTRVLMPRPNNIKDFSKDYIRWLTAFLSIHKNKKFILTNLILNLVSCMFPPILLMLSIKKLVNTSYKDTMKRKKY